MTNAEQPKQSPAFRIRRKAVAVRWHEGNKQWTICIGKYRTKNGKLRPKDWYFTMGESDANVAAQRIADKWEMLCSNWAKLYQPTLTMLRSPVAQIPHWEAAMGQTPTVQEIKEYQDRPTTAEEIINAYADATIDTVFGLYKLAQKTKVLSGDINNVTLGSVEKDCKNAITYLPNRLLMEDLTLAVLTDAKSNMLGKLGRRTVKNYLTALKQMLRWWYDKTDYGKAHDKPTNFEDIFNISNATRTDVKIPSSVEVKNLLAIASDRTRLYILLALNCGMYQSDIGHLTLDEINLNDGYIYWDREKEPTNPFRVRHNLWPETLAAVRKHVQGETAKRLFVDYRHGKAIEVDCSKLAFVDPHGNPLSRVRENGTQYDKITESWKEIKRKNPSAPIFRSLRKVTNNALVELLNTTANGNEQALFAVGEISNMFLAQSDAKLKRLYKTSGLHMYDRMNLYLGQVGDVLRQQGVLY